MIDFVAALFLSAFLAAWRFNFGHFGWKERLSPRVRYSGECPLAICRFLWRKIRNAAARPVLAAALFGDNVAKNRQSRQPLSSRSLVK